jgi:hypothetical protein
MHRILIVGLCNWSVVGKSVQLAVLNEVGFFGGAPVITTINPNNNRCKAL